MIQSLKIILVLLLSLVCLGLVFSQSEDKLLFNEAETRFRAKHYEFALNRYEELIKNFPLSSYAADAQFRRAVCLFRLDRHLESLDLFKTVENRYFSTRFSAFVPFWIGVIEYNQANFVNAAEYLRLYIAGSESSLTGQARLYLAICEEKLGNYPQAIAELELLLSQSEDTDLKKTAQPLMGSLYIKQKQYTEMLSLADNIDFSDLDQPQIQRIKLYIAEANWHKQEFDSAVATYTELVDASPDISSIAYQRLFLYYQRTGEDQKLQQTVLEAEINLAGNVDILSEFWLRIGIESFGEGKFELAESYLQRVWGIAELTTLDGLVPLYLAEIMYQDGRKSRAIDILQSFAAASDSRSELVQFRLASYYLQTEAWPEAESLYRLFMSRHPDSRYYSEVSYLLALSLYRQKKYSEAIAAIDSVLGQTRGGAYTPELLYLKSILLQKTGDFDGAVQSLREYIPLNEADAKARMDIIKLLFRQKNFPAVVSEINKIHDIAPFNDSSTEFYLLTQYMYGLSFISQKSYEQAYQILELLTLNAVQDAGLLIIYPYVLYYRGWAYYRSGDYLRAEKDFADLLSGATDHELQPRAAYLASWCAYVLGKYAQVERYLQQMSSDGYGLIDKKADFLYAKSLLGQQNAEEAAVLFQNIYLQDPSSVLADDALFEFAQVMANLDKVTESVAAYYTLYEQYPTSPLAEEGLYNRGELLYAEGQFDEAKKAFYTYRTRFPKGSLYDAALYWSGMASINVEEAFGAVLLWEKLVESYRESAFRADALMRTAEVYEGTGDFRKSLNYYGELLAVYPEEAKAISAEQKIEKLRYLILGQSEDEAQLSVIISREGSGTRVGRESMLELARIYIYKSGSKQNLAPSILDEVLAKKDEDPESAARAQYFLGEYYYRKNDLKRAANEFLQAVVLYPQGRDLAAQALYRAAEMTKIAGNLQETRALVDRLEELFPSSQWVESGRKLLESDR